MRERKVHFSRRTFSTLFLTVLSGCSALKDFSNDRSIEVEASEITWTESQTTQGVDTSQILFSESESELLVAGNFVASGKLVNLYPNVLTTTASGHNKIQVRIEESVESTQTSSSNYTYLTAIRFQWVPDSVEILVQHQQSDGEITTVLHRTIPDPQTTTPSQ